MVNKIFSVLVWSLFLCCSAIAQNREIQFEHLNFEQLKDKARKEQKNVFIDCYTTWCGPCKQMSKFVFTQDSVADFINQSFVPAKIDMETEEGQKIAKKYEVESYPTFLFIDPDGNLIYKFIGGVKASIFLSESKKGLNEDNDYRLMNLTYESGNYTADFMAKYIQLKFSRNEFTKAKILANEYFNSLSREEKCLPKNWFLFGENTFSYYISSSNSRNANYLVDYSEDFIKHLPDTTVFNRIQQNFKGIITSVIRGRFSTDDQTNPRVFDEFKERINAIPALPNKEQLLVYMDVCKAAINQDSIKVIRTLAKNVGSFSEDYQHLLFDIFGFYLDSQKKKKTADVYELIRNIVISNKNTNLTNYVRTYLGSNDPHYEKFDAKNLKGKFDQPEIVPFFHPSQPAIHFTYRKANQKPKYMTFNRELGTRELYNKKTIDSVMLTMELDTTGILFTPSFTDSGIALDFVTNNGKSYQYIPTDKKIVPHKKKTFTPVEWGLSPDNKFELFEKDQNIFVRDLKDSTEVQLTHDGTGDAWYMLADVTWFGDKNKFIIYRKDDRNVRKLSVINSLTTVPSTKNYKDALPGDTGVTRYELFLGDAEKKTLTKIDTEKWNGQELFVVRSDNKDLFYFTRLKRTHDLLELCSVDENGEVKVLIEEKCQPNFNDMMFSCKIINKGNDILFWSDRTGWGHYYRYNKNGKLLNALTKGEWTAGRIMSIDERKGEIYFQGYGKDKNVNPNYSFLYKVKLNGSGLKLLTPETAHHKTYISTASNLIIDNYSTIDTAPLIVARDCNGKFIDTVIKPDVKPLLDYGWKYPEQFKVKAADNETNLYGIMWKPYNFDPNKKYPIISQVYPGPFTETVWPEFTVLDKYQNTALAQRGFIVVCFGHRGSSPTRNKAYASYGFGNLRDYPIADDKYGIEQLARTYSYIDSTKVGIVGHSGGAFMAATAICTYPDFYKVAVASSGNYDNTIYHKNWGEYYQGIGEDLKFKVQSPMELVSNLKGKLLLVTGESDENVNPSHTYRMVDALIKADKDFDLLVIPSQGHHYEGVYDDYFERRKRDYFTINLLENNKK